MIPMKNTQKLCWLNSAFPFILYLWIRIRNECGSGSADPNESGSDRIWIRIHITGCLGNKCCCLEKDVFASELKSMNSFPDTKQCELIRHADENESMGLIMLWSLSFFQSENSVRSSEFLKIFIRCLTLHFCYRIDLTNHIRPIEIKLLQWSYRVAILTIVSFV